MRGRGSRQKSAQGRRRIDEGWILLVSSCGFFSIEDRGGILGNSGSFFEDVGFFLGEGGCEAFSEGNCVILQCKCSRPIFVHSGFRSFDYRSTAG